MSKNDSTSTYVIMPVYNEAKVVADTIKRVREQYEHVICVDDGSSDASWEQIIAAGGTLVRHPINLGQGAALQTGIDYALLDPKAKYFVTYDADGQHRLEDVAIMLKELHAGDVDIVLGSRFLGNAENINGVKRVVLKAAIVYSNYTSGLRLTDAHNGLRVFKRNVAESLNITMPDMAHASEIVHRIADCKFKYKEVPVTIKYTDYSMSKGQSVMNAINISFDLWLRRMSGK